MIVLNLLETTLPLTNPVLKFFVILCIILLAPLLLNKIKIPPLLGLIIAGAVIGQHGINLMVRDSSIILSGTAGLLYIMFLAGLEIDLADFRRNSKKSLVFGMYTFLIPMALGIASGLLLRFSLMTSVLLASMFASHTLIAYPIVNKLGVAKNRAVNVTVGGTMITDTLALLVLAVIVGMTRGEVNAAFWIRLSASVVVFGLVVMLVFPLIARWFFRRVDDNVSQYIFVLAMVFLAAVLAEMAQIEAIIGAFLAGLALNRLIPRKSPLMNRIEFVGNAIFIPFFLIGVGMLIDYRAFFSDAETLKVAAVMIGVATSAKFLAAWLTQKTFGFTADERRLIFGLSNAQAAATLAAVLIGYNIIVGETAEGEPIRLLGDSILNGTILMILITCALASFVAQKGARNIALSGSSDTPAPGEAATERILIPVSNEETADELMTLGVTIRSEGSPSGLYALSIVDSNAAGGEAERRARKLLGRLAQTAAATDNRLHELLRYDLNVVNGITGVVRENRITDLILGLHIRKGLSDSFLGNLTEGVLAKCSTTTFIYRPAQPFATLKRHLVIVPANAEREPGFIWWLARVWNMARNAGAVLVFYGTPETLRHIGRTQAKNPVECRFETFTDWDDFLVLARGFRPDDNLVVVMSRRDKLSYHPGMARIPRYLNRYFRANSFLLIYPVQEEGTDSAIMNLDPTLLEPLEKLDAIGKIVSGLFRRKE